MPRVAMVMVVGCGGIDAPPQDASVDVDATVDDADGGADAACAPTCPNDPPQPNTACSMANRLCEYAAVDGGCRSRFVCQAGSWTLTSGVSAICDKGDASRCGASLAETEGTSCDTYSRCDFDGAICVCGAHGFACEHATSSCPVPRPLLGSACSPSEKVCTSYLDLECTPAIGCRDCVWAAEYLHTCP